jgi:hypothetical protein
MRKSKSTKTINNVVYLGEGAAKH